MLFIALNARWGEAGSCRTDCELLDHRVSQQLTSQFSHSRHCRLVRGPAELYLKSLPLPDPDHLSETEAMRRAGDRLALRIMDLGLEHHLDDDSGHGWQRTWGPGLARACGDVCHDGCIHRPVRATAAGPETARSGT